MPSVFGVFEWGEHAHDFLDELQSILGSESIDLRPAMRNPLEESPDDWPTEEDPLGAARLAGTPIGTIPGVGMMIIPNSTMVDVSLRDFGRLLEELANESPRHEQPAFGARMHISMEVPTGMVEEVLNHLHRHGVEVSHVDRE